MSPKNSAVLRVVPGLLLVAACKSERGEGAPDQSAGVDSAIIVDSEVRTYVEQKLRPYLTSVAKATCSVRAAAAPRRGRYGICVPARGRPGVEALDDPKAEGVTIPPKDGKPFPQPDTLGGKSGIDNEVSDYIENKLRPYLDSLAHVTCAVRAAAAPQANAYGLCGPVAETINPPPKNRAPYPKEKVRPAADNEIREYIETALRPWLLSLAKMDCELRALLAGSGGRYGICLQASAGRKDFEPLTGFQAEVVTVPPKNGKPYPSPEARAPGR